MIIKKVITYILCLFSLQVFAQDDLLNMLENEIDSTSTSQKVIASFKGIKLVNANTTKTTAKKVLEFRITHRFGNMQLGKPEGVHSLGGIDNATNIRFSFDYGLSDKLSIGIGRSKTLEHVDGNLKYRFLEQIENKIPFSAAYFVNVAVTPTKDEKYEQVTDRLSYVHQLIIASKITSSLSLEILPTFVHRNFIVLVPHPTNNSTDNNDLISLGFAGRFKITKRMAIVADYFFTFSDFRDSNNSFYAPFGVGLEFDTGGHIFHVNVTNSSGIIENDFIPYTNESWGDGNYKLGFNISRVFNF